MNPSVGALLEEGVRALVHPHIDDARREAQVLLGHALGVSRAWLVAHRDDAAAPEGASRFRQLLQKRSDGQPVAYLTGEREFHGVAFRVSPAVLIPRADTETLVDAALETLPVGGSAAILDLGTGSGCVAVALAQERAGSVVTAVDASKQALDIARQNALDHGVEIEFLQGDWFAAVGGRAFHLIVSNPPYIALGDPHLERGDLRFEPPGALASGPDGLSDIRRIVAGAPLHLHPGGWLLFEHGHDQAEACANLLREAGFDPVAAFRPGGHPPGGRRAACAQPAQPLTLQHHGSDLGRRYFAEGTPLRFWRLGS